MKINCLFIISGLLLCWSGFTGFSNDKSELQSTLSFKHCPVRDNSVAF